MKLKTRVQSQRDSRWGSIMLGYNTVLPYNIYNYGCLITSLANYVDKQPDQVNQLLKDNSGFQNGGLFVWSKSTVLGLNQVYLSPRCQAVSLYATEVVKLREYLKSGKPALCEVDFNPATDEYQMHYVLAVGYTDTEIIVVDPWEGQYESWTDASFQRNTYQFRIYDKTLQQDDGGTNVAVDSKTFENLVRKSTIYDKVRVKLNVEDNETIILSELEKLIGYEDSVVKKDKQLIDAQTQIDTLKRELLDVTVSHNALQDSYDALQDKFNLDTVTISTLKDKLELLEAQIVKPVYSGWKKALIALIDRF